MNYKILWTDMHSNLHHQQIDQLEKWADQVRKTMDFWPIAYYPYTMRKDECGLEVEDRFELEVIEKDWETIREFTRKVNQEGFPMFMGYEWQGAGLDGDHNVFFKDNTLDMAYPMRYAKLKEIYSGKNVIAIPHHLAYQLENRGKNWDTHDENFSPFVEIYSSHGSSENDETCIEMNRHIHMGPRTDATCVEKGWNDGYQFGVIASGDNHSCPGVYGFGYCAVLANSNSKEDIWDAFIHRRVYGVSKDKIQLNFELDSKPMGSAIEKNKKSKLLADVVGSNTLDRIEILQDNEVIEMIPHLVQKKELKGKVRFKFQLDLGWGPDRRIFPDIDHRNWKGKLETKGTLCSIEKCWSNFGQELFNVTNNSCDFEITSYKTTATGKWMGPSAVTTEGFIFEIEDQVDSFVKLTIDDIVYELPIRELIQSSRIIPLLDEAKELLNSTFGFNEYYRSDPWWHNAYKIKIGKAALVSDYTTHIEREINTENVSQIRLRIWQKNGSVAWSSPVFIKKEKD